MNKKEFLLDSIIKAYIEHLEPIGSGQLKSMYDISFSPATIRGYFKKLGEEGYLAQEHASSGRTPTNEALKEYWKSRLSQKLGFVDYNRLNLSARQIGLTVFLKQEQSQTLNRVLDIEQTYILLEFTSFSISIKFNGALFKFLTDMIGLDASNIMEISEQVGAYELYSELDKYLYNNNFEIINIKDFLKLIVDYDFEELQINKFLNGSIMNKLSEGIHYNGGTSFGEILPNDYLAVVHNIKIGYNDYKMLVIGQLSKDYEYFYKGIVNG